MPQGAGVTAADREPDRAHMPHALFAVLGVEGSGKTTQIRAVARALRRDGCSVRVVRDPGSTTIGEAFREVLKLPEYEDLLDPETRLRMFTIARRALTEQVVRPSLAAGTVVLLDRSYPCTIAYQAYGEGLDLTHVTDLCRKAVGGLEPDRMFLLDIPIEEIARRVARRAGNRDHYDNEEPAFHVRVRNGYLRQLRDADGRIVRIDATQTSQVVTQEILTHLRADLNIRGIDGD